MDLDSRVLRPNDHVSLRGRLIRDASALRLAPLWTDPTGLITPVESMAVDLLGWDRPSPTNSVTVLGVWDGAALVVTEIAPSLDGASGFAFAPLLGEEVDLDLPVLDAVGTTPDTDEREDAVRALTDRGAALHYAQVRTGNGVAHIVSASDVDAVEAALRPLLRETLVVVPNSWTRAELDAVQQILSEEEEEAGLFMSGEGLDPRGHYRASGWVRQITPRLAKRLAPYPGGIVALDSWLEPTHEVA
jgi:hypothetical protein